MFEDKDVGFIVWIALIILMSSEKEEQNLSVFGKTFYVFLLLGVSKECLFSCWEEANHFVRPWCWI